MMSVLLSTFDFIILAFEVEIIPRAAWGLC